MPESENASKLVLSHSSHSGHGSWRGSSPPPQQASILGVITAGACVELVRGGFQRLEGRVATPDGGLFFSDVKENRTYKLYVNGTISVWRENTKRANGLFLLNRIVSLEPRNRVIHLTCFMLVDGFPVDVNIALAFSQKILIVGNGPKIVEDTGEARARAAVNKIRL